MNFNILVCISKHCIISTWVSKFFDLIQHFISKLISKSEIFRNAASAVSVKQKTEIRKEKLEKQPSRKFAERYKVIF